MKRIVCMVAVLLPLCVHVHADAKSTQSGYESATVVSVDSHMAEPYYRGSGTDAPLQVRTYSYDIGIRLDCTDYIGRYESATKYLPSVFAPNHEVDVRLRKHTLYVSLPSSDDEVTLGIVGHHRVKDESCEAPTSFSGNTVNHHASNEGHNKGEIL